MTVNDPNDPAIGNSEEQQPGVARKNRGVRFSDPEWDEVKRAAQALDLTPAEFVRERILELVRTPGTHAPPALRADLAPLIERTFRYTYMLATHMRDELTGTGREGELETLISEARKLQDELLASEDG